MDNMPTMRFLYNSRYELWICPNSHENEQICDHLDHICQKCGEKYLENDIEVVYQDRIPVIGGM
jgi:hypothetical protein